jgi:hypothetical protein
MIHVKFVQDREIEIDNIPLNEVRLLVQASAIRDVTQSKK